MKSNTEKCPKRTDAHTSRRPAVLFDMTACAMGAALICLCAWVTVPAALPFTMQLFAVFACIGLLGTRRSLYAIGLYLLLGCIGLPVFSGFSGGFGHIIGATGGFLWGFMLSALVSGPIISVLSKKLGSKLYVYIIGFVVGLLICYAAGTAWFTWCYAGTGATVGYALTVCVVPFIIPDIIKLALAALLTVRVRPYISFFGKDR